MVDRGGGKRKEETRRRSLFRGDITQSRDSPGMALNKKNVAIYHFIGKKEEERCGANLSV